MVIAGAFVSGKTFCFLLKTMKLINHPSLQFANYVYMVNVTNDLFSPIITIFFSAIYTRTTQNVRGCNQASPLNSNIQIDSRIGCGSCRHDDVTKD